MFLRTATSVAGIGAPQVLASLPTRTVEFDSGPFPLSSFALAHAVFVALALRLHVAATIVKESPSIAVKAGSGAQQVLSQHRSWPWCSFRTLPSTCRACPSVRDGRDHCVCALGGAHVAAQLPQFTIAATVYQVNPRAWRFKVRCCARGCGVIGRGAGGRLRSCGTSCASGHRDQLLSRPHLRC